MWRRPLALAIVVAATAAVLAAVLRGVDPARVAAAAAGARSELLPLLIAAFALNQGFRILRWHVLLGAVPLRRSAIAACIGFLATMVLPLRLGELARPVVQLRDGVPLGRSASAVLVERTLDLFALLLFLGWTTAVADLPPIVSDGVDLVAAGRRAAAVGTVVLAVAVISAAAAGERLAHVPVAGSFLADVARSARELASSPARAALGAGLTVGCWGSVVLYVEVALSAFPGLPADLEAAAVTWAAVIAAVTVLPTPGFLGSYEAGAVGALALYGVDLDVARAFALGLHLAYFLFVAALGVLAMAIEGERWSVLAGRARPTEQ